MSEAPDPAARSGGSWLRRGMPWLITLLCFGVLYWKIQGQAARDQKSTLDFLASVFAGVSWTRWLALMIPYSAFFLIIDSLVIWRVINWFNTRLGYLEILPIRASAYIISILDERIGKGAIAYYLHRRDGVPGWQVGSSMLFVMFCEIFYLLTWATLGVALRGDRLPPVFHAIPWIALGAVGVLAVWLLYFQGVIAPGSTLRDRQIFHAFRRASLWNYAAFIVLRSPAMIAGVVVYTLALRLFGVEAELLDMLAFVPVVFFGAAVPGPFRAVAITLWTYLYPENPGQMAAFGLVQHNFFVFFNAAIGLLFLRRTNRELARAGAGGR
ncbi:MAG: hypothetical protein ACHQ3O_03810 [Candidatus Limnocylindria bacterium]